jgi:ABC-type glycerol-3-phosphate transport system substrate-binding protein
LPSPPVTNRWRAAGPVLSTWKGKKYGLPFVVDLSVWMYNKKLFKAAGLDPNKHSGKSGPTLMTGL